MYQSACVYVCVLYVCIYLCVVYRYVCVYVCCMFKSNQNINKIIILTKILLAKQIKFIQINNSINYYIFITYCVGVGMQANSCLYAHIYSYTTCACTHSRMRIHAQIYI